MDTAKVDIRKLQLLNDRINQVIDALNQVRLSVHGLGLSHTSAPWLQGAAWPQAYGMNAAIGAQVPFGQVPFAQGAYGQSAYGQLPYGQGLAHTTGFIPQSPFFAPLGLQANQIGIPGFVNQAAIPGFVPQNWMPLVPSTGLSHSSVELNDLARLGYAGANVGSFAAPYAAIDPFTMARLSQVFPYAQYAYTPAV